MSLFHTIILAIIEGLTEFLPVSSTGHMILASSALGIQETEFVKTFEIAIQLGAIMAVAVVYFKRFLSGINIYLKLLAAFIPTAVIGKLAYKTIKTALFNPYVVSVSLIVGGILLLLLDRWSKEKKTSVEKTENISWGGAFITGLVQCLSMVPGVSRAAASIFGGMIGGFNRRQAAEFSFLLAIPTMLAATAYDLLKTKATLDHHEIKLMLIGGIIAFFSALLVVKTFIGFIDKYGFKPFGYYRIAAGIAFLLMAYYGKLLM